jgi:tetratricopeptide (TPR) repeat protein
MPMSAYFFALFLLAGPLPQDDVRDALAHAEALYYEARFNESIQLLSRIDTALRPQSERVQEKVTVKVQLALAHIGLNQTGDARSLFQEVFLLDPDFKLDEQDFSPKILALASDAKAAADENRCRMIQNDAQRLLESEDGVGLYNLIKSKKAACPDLEMLEPLTSELLYKVGMDLYKKGDLTNALVKFRNVIELAPKHELATQYIDLISSKQQIGVDRLYLDWQKSFVGRDSAVATARYRELKPLNPTMAAQMRDEYRKSVSQILDSWKRACAAGDSSSIESLRRQAADLLPEPGIADDLLNQMKVCTSTTCLQMTSTLVMTRIKTRVNPSLSASDVGRNGLTLRAQVKIDKNGDVVVSSVQGGTPHVNETVRDALGRWKFTPITDEYGPRCVDAEIPLSIKSNAP